jgi:hypothetical protein
MKMLTFKRKPRPPLVVYVVEMTTHVAGVLPTLEDAKSCFPSTQEWVEFYHGDMRRWSNGKPYGDIDGLCITEWEVTGWEFPNDDRKR